ncbi:serine/threonine-protein phosphatase 6 regulatory subunit 3 [Phtheirospermum japonicum]|uniref:Serine/threonine-protein phosphatase 6 regulatory subunit 3 n=1 Tax=Phtheirospermum japonicum TaxID=374723 RepID=A0A830CJK8_9LAMI|nr:serine/threonine-protein phosphatase 6 regulatory subunit 3 [Phtheirospermum japonicum]
MFWRMAGLSTASPVEAILDKENFTLVELLDEDEIIQECKALNGRLINFLRERANVKQLIQYIVEEAPEDADRQRTFKFPFIACEIFTCEVDIILKALVEDEELMDLLFSFLDPERPHSTQLAGYFSKAHQDIIKRLVDLIGITSIMEVLIRLIGADEHIYANYPDSMQWLEDMNVLEMIVDKFSSSDCPEVHGNAAETLCTITRYAPPGIASKISSPSFIGRLFRHALEDSRPKSVLVNLLSVCISLLDPKRLTSGTYYLYSRQMTHGSGSAANPETPDLIRLAEYFNYPDQSDLLKLLDISPEGRILLTTYGKLQPPLGKQRLKIIEFISVLVAVSSEVAEKELVRLGAVKRILELFFEYPFNNFLHYHVEHIISSCLESKNPQFVEHLFHDCNLIGRILEAEKNFTLAVDTSKPTTAAEGRPPARIGNIGHITRIANKLVQLGNSNSEMQTFLQGNDDWVEWHANVLLKRNAVENVFQWACGRPTALQDRTRDSDEDDYQDRDYDVAALANNLSQAFRYGIYNNDDMEETHGSLERGDEDVYFDDESAEVVISSLRLGDDQDSGSLFTNSNWFAFEDEKTGDEHSSDPITSSSPNSEPPESVKEADNDVTVEEDEDLTDTATSESPEPKPTPDENTETTTKLSEGPTETETSGSDKPPEWVEWRESSHSIEFPPTSNSTNTADAAQEPPLPNGEVQVGVAEPDAVGPHKTAAEDDSPASKEIESGKNPTETAEVGEKTKAVEN